ncbi:hypothetical protein QGM71_08770 [Virgibacillus sp. C22-A2]|uniref:Uncharacterized protein n=1 Tax=Virgibacillus tibetensis TaxID=3042313 RepID=A0ABU6KE14_9BACI|nr:hypothetical protein [Virgibacillus sp. C22-A2]
MGYILPIQHYQYNDYQNRIIKDKQNYFMIEKPFKVILEKQHQEVENQYNFLINPNESALVNSPGTSASESVYGTLTGKGKNFSESI